MKKIFIAGLALTLIFTSVESFSAFSYIGWQKVSWKYQYRYPNGESDTNTYLKYYFTDEGSYDGINAYYSSGGENTIARASTKDGGDQVVNGPKASALKGYPNTSMATQGAQRGDDYARWIIG